MGVNASFAVGAITTSGVSWLNEKSMVTAVVSRERDSVYGFEDFLGKFFCGLIA